jgi:hypothetical protein
VNQTHYSKERIEYCKLESYNPDACCGANCDWLGKHREQPCYGPVKYLGDGIHACIGHEDMDICGCYIYPKNAGY